MNSCDIVVKACLKTGPLKLDREVECQETHLQEVKFERAKNENDKTKERQVFKAND